MPVRQLTPAHAGAYLALRLSSLREAPAAAWSSYEEERALAPAEIAERLEPGPVQAAFGWFDGDELLGLALLRHDARAKIRHRATVWGVYVAPAARGRGVAGELMRALVAHARAAPGLRQLTLVVDSANGGAVRLYAALGFTVTGIDSASTCIDGVLRDELRMQLVLTPQPR